jgi:Flp pilus assembly pilin Flp
MVRAVLVCFVALALVGPVYAAPDQTQQGSLVGVYTCEGTNPDGTAYSGIVEIIEVKDTYLVRWTMPNESQVVGVGILNGSMLSVSYYGGTPAIVVYAVAASGKLSGKWTAGGAEGSVFTETLTKMPEGTAKPKPKPTKRESDTGPRITV